MKPTLTLTPVENLTSDPENARVHSERNLDTIKESLREFGQRKPIVVTQAGIVLAGNGTLEAARRLGWTQIAVVTVPNTWTYEEARAFAIADNRTAELAKWNGELLSSQLDSLEASGFSPATLGFKIVTEPTPQQNPTHEIDVDSFHLEHSCPSCGFDFNG